MTRSGPVSGLRANFIAVTATVVGVLPLFLVGGLSIHVREELNFSLTELGFTVSVYFATSALFSSPAGAFIERIGYKRGLIVSVSTSGVALASIGWFAGSWAQLLVLLALAGVANATTQVASNLLLARSVIIRRQGVSYGVKQAAIPIATLLAGASLGTVVSGLGWRNVFLIAGMLAAIVVVSVLSLAPQPATERVSGRALNTGEIRALVVVAVAAALASGVANTLGAFLVESLVSWMSQDEAGLVLAVGSVSGIVARIGSGWIVDRSRFNPMILGIAQLTIAIGGYLLLSTATSRPIAFLATIVAFATGWGWTGVLTYAVATRYSWAPAKATGITQAGIYTGAVVGPAAFGYMVESASYRTAWIVSAGVVAIAAMVLTVGMRLMGGVGKRPATAQVSPRLSATGPERDQGVEGTHEK